MPNVISLREPGARQYLRRTNTDARLGRLCRAVRRDWYSSQAIRRFLAPAGSAGPVVNSERSPRGHDAELA